LDRSGALIFEDGASIVICGAAGQGIQTIEKILPQLARLSGFHVCATKEYMSRIRGGSNSTEIRVSSRPVTSYARGIDLLIPLDEAALGHLDGRIGPRTLIVGDAARIKPDREIVDVPFRRMAEEIGGPIYENVVGAGVAAGIFGLDRGESENHIRRHFSGKKEDVAAANVEAFRAGFDRGAALVEEGRVAVEIGRSPDRGKEILASGAEAIALGALHGGCNFVAAYPMTPSTGVFAFLARHSEKLGIIAEQAEDEIAAINMSLGAWYAGARAMVTTSGGGFALMAEGLSLAGMIESPAVIFLSQRPGPATGLPTRTEQGDLLFALFAGHGEFPRAVLAPGTLEEAFSLTAKAFDLADRFQVPVIIMADQFFVDLQHNIPPFDMGTDMVTRHFVRTEKDYRRYEMSQNGLSPRGIPGYGEGLVGLDSDEHDEAGHITEDLDLRRRMVDKRLAKAVLLAEAALPPVLFGQEEYETLLVGWGSTCGPVREAAGQVGRDGISFLHVAQVHPLHRSVRGLLEKAKKVVVVENNATGQFASVLRMHLGIGADAAILKYDGMPFSVEELAERIEEEAAR
jgi:2-oxoglutarate ferredoxin oxidoreductase subunit alpha